jgi:uncharacterized protein YbjT (DUF2867 family)
MATSGKVLITGATGTVGSIVLERLATSGADPRALARDAAKARALRARRVEVAVAEFLQPATLGPALAGVHTVFLVTPIGPEQVAQATNLIRAATASGDQPRIVRLSVQQAAHDAPTRVGRQHAAIEDALAASGLPYTVLRPQSFMQNTLTAAPTVAAEGAIYQPFKAGRLAMVDARDVAEVAARVLTEEGHDGEAYTLTGPAAISMDDVARALTEALGTAVRYVDVPLEAAKAALLRRGVPEWLADALNEYARVHAEGYSDFTTGDVARLTGHPATAYQQFARDFAPRFRCG